MSIEQPKIDSRVLENIKIARDALYEYSKQNEFKIVEFDMRHWCFLNDSELGPTEALAEKNERDNINNCNTSACALGHISLLLGVDENHPQFKPIDEEESYYEYGSRLFGTDGKEPWDITDNDTIGTWLFSPRWTFDNTLEGAIWRMDYVLENWGVPVWFLEYFNKEKEKNGSCGILRGIEYPYKTARGIK